MQVFLSKELDEWRFEPDELFFFSANLGIIDNNIKVNPLKRGNSKIRMIIIKLIMDVESCENYN